MIRYLIIGSGAAGFAAAEAIRSKDQGGEITMITDDPHCYYSRPGLAYYLTGEISEGHLFPVEANYFKQINVRRGLGKVTRIDPINHRVHLNGHGSLPYDRLLVAVGAQATAIRAPGDDLAGVVKLDHLLDARQIQAFARKAKSAVVVGGGITALELVEGLVANRVKVHYFLRGDRYWSSVLDETESRIVEQRLIDHGIFIHYQTELESILGKKGRVSGVRTKNGETIRCEMVAYAIGIKPRLELAQVSGLETARGIQVNETLQTSAEDIFAAGDVAQVYDPVLGKSVLDSLWNPARQQGHCAGLNMAGSKVAYRKTIPFNVTRLAGLTTTIIGVVGMGRGGDDGGDEDPDLRGIARGDSETWRALPDAITAQTGFDVNHLRLMVGEKHLLGALVMGDQKLSKPLQDIITKNVDISPIYAALLKPRAPLADILIDFYASWRANRGQNEQP